MGTAPSRRDRAPRVVGNASSASPEENPAAEFDERCPLLLFSLSLSLSTHLDRRGRRGLAASLAVLGTLALLGVDRLGLDRLGLLLE